jgi:hypothetical protein
MNPTPSIAVSVLTDQDPFRAERSRELVGGISDHVAALMACTFWSRQELCHRLGLASLNDWDLVSTGDLAACTRYLEVVAMATTLVSTIHDRRQVVIECASMVRVIDEMGDVRDAPCAMDEALREIDDEGLSPLEYIRLGEVERAGMIVRAGFDSSPFRSTSPYGHAPRVHLSAPRIRMMIDDERELLGEPVFAHMTEHVQTCAACQQAAAFCMARPWAHRA